MNTGQLLFSIWLTVFTLIMLLGLTYLMIDTIKRIKRFNKALRIEEVYTIDGKKATCENDILVDMLLAFTLIFVIAIFWPICLVGAITAITRVIKALK